MRLIDAEGSELQTQLKIIREAEYQIYGSGSWGFTAKCEDAIEDAPTIQPEIVRCGECKYHYQRNCPIERYFSLNGFCSRGKRREVTE